MARSRGRSDLALQSFRSSLQLSLFCRFLASKGVQLGFDSVPPGGFDILTLGKSVKILGLFAGIFLVRCQVSMRYSH